MDAVVPTAIYVPQSIISTGRDTIYPLHVFHLVSVSHPYRVVDETRAIEFDEHERKSLLHATGGDPNLMYKVVRGAYELSAILSFEQPGHSFEAEVVSIHLGSRSPLQVGFDATLGRTVGGIKEQDFHPQARGATIELPGHSVYVDITARESGAVKTYDVDIMITTPAMEQSGAVTTNWRRYAEKRFGSRRSAD